jgi:hypothetical protein
VILILSIAEDVHVAPVARLLDELGAPYRRFDPGATPDHSFLDIEASSRGYRAGVSGRAWGSIDFRSVTAVWYRRPSDPSPPAEEGEPDVRRFITSNRRAVLHGFWNQLDCTWLPGLPAVEELAGNKAYQLSVASRLGFRLPRTRITASPQALVAMYVECRGRVVIKPLLPFWNSTHDEQRMYTRAISRRELRGYLGLARTPMIVQEHLAKRCDLRVTVVGRQVFAAEINSQARTRTAVDFRHNEWQLEHRVHELPPAEARRCVQLVSRLGLCFGAIDMVLTPRGDYVFLEINPNGQWLWIEHATKLPIANAVARHLAGAIADK